jgi:hypothetical protein
LVGVVLRRLDGAADAGVLDRLRRQHATSPFWHERLAAFGLHPDDIAAN